MELHCMLSVIGLSTVYFGSLIENCYGEKNMTETVTKATPEFYTEIITELITYMDDNFTTGAPEEHSSRRTTPSVPRTPRPTKPKDMTMYPPSRVPNHPFRDGDAGLWIAIAVVCFAAIIVVFFLLASVVLRWRRKEESSYDLDRENAHANPAYESGEIAGLEPANGLQEVRIGLTTFPDDESKTAL